MAVDSSCASCAALASWCSAYLCLVDRLARSLVTSVRIDSSSVTMSKMISRFLSLHRFALARLRLRRRRSSSKSFPLFFLSFCFCFFSFFSFFYYFFFIFASAAGGA